MSPKHQVYLLDPQKIPPETIAVAFAKTSRAPESFREIADELNDEKSAQFHEKWVVGYGHSSVAEHAVLHIAVEDISRLAVETLEGNRLASYTEKSTRYQKWDEESFVIPDELDDNPQLKQKYINTSRLLFRTYAESLPILQSWISNQFPQREEENEEAWERRLRSKYVDICRFLLPASATANVGVTINARALEHAIRKMLSHPLAEVRQIGEKIKQVSQENVPTLVKYADQVPYLINTQKVLQTYAKALNNASQSGDWCQLVQNDTEAEKRVLAAVLYRFSQLPYQVVWDTIQQLDPQKTKTLAEEIVKDLGKFDIPLRELEYANFTFDLIMDQGAYFEIKRHRMTSQTPQPLTTHLGYAVPTGLRETGFEATYHTVMLEAHQTFKEMEVWNPDVASYIVPNAFNRRVLLHGNFRSLDHLIQLRSASNAHFSVRRIAQRMADEIEAIFPLAALWLRKNRAETWQDVEEKYFLTPQKYT